MLINVNKKIISLVAVIMFVSLFLSGVYAASASISANKTSGYVGDTVTVTVRIKGAAWNVNVSGAASGSVVGYNAEGENQTTTKSYSIKLSKKGTYKVSISGDVTDASENTSYISDSVTITAKEKPAAQKETPKTTKPQATKSSNANISKLTLGVEGFKFSKNQTTYSVKVGENVNKISVGVTLESSKATYTISGNNNLKAGNNVIKIVVTAENGNTKTYKINVIKDGNVEESSSELSNLIIENMSFTERFDPTVTEYIGSKMKYVEKLNVLVYTVAEEATYEIIGNENFKEGNNEIVIKVTSKDKTSTTEYKVKFEMLHKDETDAYVEINPYVEQAPSNNKFDWKKNLVDTVKENATMLLLYILALVEFLQVIYLYVQLKELNPNQVGSIRRKSNKDEMK